MIFFGNMPDSDGNVETIDVPGNLRTPSETFDFFENGSVFRNGGEETGMHSTTC